MKNHLSCLLLVFVVVSIGVNASQPTGHQLAAYYAKKAAAEAKQGYVSSAASGFQKGASYGSLAGLPTAIAMSRYASPVNEWGRNVVGPVIAGAAFGALVGSATSMWYEAFNRNSSPAWVEQIEKLVAPDYKAAISEGILLLAGVPTDQVQEKLEKDYKKPGMLGRLFDRNAKFIRKTYLVSSIFSNIENADNGNHYEIYLMPKDENLVTMFLNVNLFFQDSRFINKIDFIALRPTPGVTKSPYNSKNMPRIIIGFTPQAGPEIVAEAMAMIAFMTIKNEPVTKLGLGIQPRYSYCPFNKNNFMYVAYGSADYKDSEAGQKEYAYKASKLWPWQSLSDEDMAFPTGVNLITEGQIQKHYNNQLNKFLNEAEKNQLAKKEELMRQDLAERKELAEIQKLQNQYYRRQKDLGVTPHYSSDL